MLKLVFLIIILYVLLDHLQDSLVTDQGLINASPNNALNTMPNTVVSESETVSDAKTLNVVTNEARELINTRITNRSSEIDKTNGIIRSTEVPLIVASMKPKELNEQQSQELVVRQNKNDKQISKVPEAQPKVWEFDRPNPWSKVVMNPTDEYPYYFHIKISIPSLNDYQSWKQVVPNLDFNPMTGELIIPSKEEPSALALANLICINFAGQMSLENILNKNLIQVSIAKARAYEVVQNKLREQIMENIYGKSFNKVQGSYEHDLARNGVDNSQPDFTSENFTDTFENFSDTNGSNVSNNMIEAWDGSDYSYL